MDWFQIWMDDKKSIISTMVKNMNADLNAGYNYFGECIKRQRREIEEYKADFDRQVMNFADMDDGKRNRWCYYDLLRRGAISR